VSGQKSDAEARSVVDRAYEQLREAILENRFEPGEPLRLLRLTRMTGASNIPVREALRRLQAEGFVEFANNRGARVTPIVIAEVSEIYHLRRILESEALSLSHASLELAQIERAKKLVSQMTEAFASNDQRRGFALHREVHFTLYRPKGSLWLMRLIELLWDNSERYLRRSPSLRPSAEDFGAEHLRFVELAAEPQVEPAVDALRQHLERTERLLRDAYTSEQDDVVIVRE